MESESDQEASLTAGGSPSSLEEFEIDAVACLSDKAPPAFFPFPPPRLLPARGSKEENNYDDQRILANARIH